MNMYYLLANVPGLDYRVHHTAAEFDANMWKPLLAGLLIFIVLPGLGLLFCWLLNGRK